MIFAGDKRAAKVYPAWYIKLHRNREFQLVPLGGMAATTDSSNNSDDLKKPKIILRTYQEQDHESVNSLFTSVYYGLVPEGIRAKLWAPFTWIVWLGVYSALMMVVPTMFFELEEIETSWPAFFLKLGISSLWAMIGFTFLFLQTERFQVVEEIAEAQQNDLSDPQVYYLNWTKEGGKAVRKPESEQTPSHFWVLTVDSVVSGFVGLAHYDDRVMNRRSNPGNSFQQVASSFCRNAGLPIASIFKPSSDIRVFAEQSEPKTAVLRRLVIDNDYQNCGLSTLMISRALVWADEHGIEKVYAQTSELELAAEQILTKRHGFKLVKTERTGLLGGKRLTLVCYVKDWIKNNSDMKKSFYKPVST